MALAGHCSCGQVRYRLIKCPLFTHCCHCSWCQRETGSAFALNAMIETALVEIEGEVERIDTPTASGKGQEIVRCRACRVALYSHYAGAGRAVAFVRVGTLDAPAACPPDIHIFTTTKQPWVVLADGKPVMEQFYRRADQWPEESLARYRALAGR